MARKLPSYRLHRATGQALVTLDGRDVYLGPHNSTASKTKYDRLIAEYLGANRRYVPLQQSITVAELADQYQRSGEARDGRDARVIAKLIPLYGQIHASEFGPLKLKAVRQTMIALGWCRREINMAIGRLKRMFRWAVSEEILPASVSDSLAAVAGLQAGHCSAPESVPVKPVPEADVRATLKYLSKPLAAVAELQLLTGMRGIELRRLRPMDLDRSGEVWRYAPPKHKTAHRGHKRTILIGPMAQAVLMPWLDRPADRLCFRPCELRTCWGERYTAVAYAAAVLRAAKRAKVPHWHPNQLRHTAATRLRAEFGIDVASTILGHRHLETTEIYAELPIAKATEAMKRAG